MEQSWGEREGCRDVERFARDKQIKPIVTRGVWKASGRRDSRARFTGRSSLKPDPSSSPIRRMERGPRWIRNRYRIRERRSVFHVDCFLFERRFHARSKREKGKGRDGSVGYRETENQLLEISGPVMTFRQDRSIFFAVKSLTERLALDGTRRVLAGILSWKPELSRACTLQVATSLCAN